MHCPIGSRSRWLSGAGVFLLCLLWAVGAQALSQECPRQGVVEVITPDDRARLCPSVGCSMYQDVTRIKTGSKLRIVDCTSKEGFVDVRWYQVRYQDELGWISEYDCILVERGEQKTEEPRRPARNTTRHKPDRATGPKWTSSRETIRVASQTNASGYELYIMHVPKVDSWQLYLTYPREQANRIREASMSINEEAIPVDRALFQAEYFMTPIDSILLYKLKNGYTLKLVLKTAGGSRIVNTYSLNGSLAAINGMAR